MSDLPEKKERPNIEGMFTLKVDYLAPHVNAEILREKFEPFGTVGDVYIPRSLRGGDEHRGFAFVRFLTREDADAAMSGLDGSELEGKEIKVQEAKEKKTERADYRNNNGRRFGGGDRDRNFNRRDYGDRDRRRNSRDRRDYDRRDRDSNRRDRDYGRDRDRGDRRDRGGDRDYGKDRDYGRDRERDRDDRGSRRDRSRSRSRSRDRRDRSRS